MTMAAVATMERKTISCPQSRDLYNGIEGILEAARMSRMEAELAEITVRRMIDDDRSVAGIVSEFEIEDGPNLSEWRVTVVFTDATQVMLTHHG